MSLRSREYLDTCPFCKNEVRYGYQGNAECSSCGLTWGHRKGQTFFPLGHRWEGSPASTFLRDNTDGGRLNILCALAAMHLEVHSGRVPYFDKSPHSETESGASA